jgi:putative DNA primase/helicase
LNGELPAIFNWAVQGWRDLQLAGRFIMPASSAEAVAELEDLGSPIGAFIRDRCVVEAGQSVEASELFKAWREWCVTQGREHAGTVQGFGRDLRAAVAGLRVTQPRSSGSRLRWYEGIGLN